MKCNQCGSNVLFITEEQGQFKKTYISPTPLLLLAIILIIGIIILSKIMKLSEELIGGIIIFSLLLIIGSCIIATINSRNNKKWQKLSRTKFTCTNCGHQWYANSDIEELNIKHK